MNLLQEFLRVIWKALLVIPMPWRAEIVIWVVALFGYQILYRFSVLLLLPEFWLTNRMRLWGFKPLPGTYVFDNIVESSIRIYRFLKLMALLVAVLGLVAWYAKPFLEDTTLAWHINQVISWWNALARRILSGS